VIAQQLALAEAIRQARAVVEHLKRAERYIDLRAGGNAQLEIRKARALVESGLRQIEQLQDATSTLRTVPPAAPRRPSLRRLR
jgi:hypothetical protein